jgi:carboxyl-terminal processing protease
MLNQLDPYTLYVPPQQQKAFDQMLDGSFEGVGIQLRQLDNGQIEVVTPMDDSPAFKAGVMAGDILLKVNGESVENVRLPDVSKKIQGKSGSNVVLRVRRESGKELELSMPREQVVVPTVKGFQRNADNGWNYWVNPKEKIAYLRITQFTADTYDKLRGQLEGLLKEGMKGLILDLRFNPGGRLDAASKVVNLFIDQGVIVSTRGRSRPEETIFANAKDTLPRFPLVVLVNGASASAAEIVSGSLKDNRRALVIGTRTFGKGSVQEVVPLEQGAGELKMTVAYYYLPSGRLVHRKKGATDWGVIPHITIETDKSQDERIFRERTEADAFHRPSTAAAEAAAATTQAINADIQLQKAIDSMMAILVLQGNNGPATQPADTLPGTTAPATPLTKDGL